MLLTAFATAGCATLGADKATSCSGARRPANPHGSVLAPALPSPTSGPTTGAAPGCTGPRA